MNDHPGRLVDDQQIGIFVDDLQWQRLGAKRDAFLRRHQLELDRLPGAQLARCRRRYRAVEPDMALRDQCLQMIARKLRCHLDQQLVEALTVKMRRHAAGTGLERRIVVADPDRGDRVAGRAVIVGVDCRLHAARARGVNPIICDHF